MKGMISVAITVVLVLIVGALYWFLAKPKMDAKIAAKKQEIAANEAHLQLIAKKIADTPMLEAQLPRWQKQFEVFRAAIPVKVEDDIFLRNLNEQMHANNVQLLNIELAQAGPWITNLNETQEQNYMAEHMKPDEIRKVRMANFSVTLSGNYADVLRAFENLKLYGRIFSINQIISPAGGAGGAVFQNENMASTPIQVDGKVYYGLSEGYLAQSTLDKYFGRAQIIGAAGTVAKAAMERADQLGANPNSTPQPPPAGAITTPPAEPQGGAAPQAAPPAGGSAGSASATSRKAPRVASTSKSHNRAAAVGG